MPEFGGIHDGFGTRNALRGLDVQYLKVLAFDPAQSDARSPLRAEVEALFEPRLLTVAIAKQKLDHPVPMSRVGPDGVRREWAVQLTRTPVFFIDCAGSPRPSGLPEGGRITGLSIRAPDPRSLDSVPAVTVREGPWRIEASVNGVALA